MRRISVVLVVSILAGGVWLTAPRSSEAGEVSISLGVGFMVGGASFQVAYHNGGYLPYYYRLETPLYYPGYDCTGHCYLRTGFYYHSPYCPVVRHHFGRYRYEGPYYGNSRYYGPRPGHHRKSHHRKSHHHRSGYRDHGYSGHSRHHYSESRSSYRSPSRHGVGSRGHARSHRAKMKHEDKRARAAYRDRAGHHKSRHSRAPGSARRTRPR